MYTILPILLPISPPPHPLHLHLPHPDHFHLHLLQLRDFAIVNPPPLALHPMTIPRSLRAPSFGSTWAAPSSPLPHPHSSHGARISSPRCCPTNSTPR